MDEELFEFLENSSCWLNICGQNLGFCFLILPIVDLFRWAKQTAHARAQILYYLAENLELRRAEFALQLQALTGAQKEVALQEVDLSVQRLFYWAAYSDKYGGAVQVRTNRALLFGYIR